MNDKILSIEQLIKIINDIKKTKKKIIATSGCFDIIHAGHIQYLEEAKSRGDVLIILLNSDFSVKKIKGKFRPIVPQDERAIVISGLGSVDYVCIFEETTPCRMLELLKPDIFIKGGDYSSKNIPEKEVMDKNGGRIEFVSLIDKCSSTNIIKKIINGKEEE